MTKKAKKENLTKSRQGNEAARLKEELMQKMKKAEEKEKKRQQKLAEERREMERIKEQALVEQAATMLTTTKKRNKSSSKSEKHCIKEKEDGNDVKKTKIVAKVVQSDGWFDDSMWDESITVSSNNNKNQKNYTVAKSGSFDDGMWDESADTASRTNNYQPMDALDNFKQELTRGSKPRSNSYRSTNAGNRDYQHNRDSRQKEERPRSSRSRGNGNGAKYRNITKDIPQQFGSNSEACWDEGEFHFNQQAAAAPLPAVNVWEKRMSKMKVVEDLLPKTELEEEAMLRRALEMSRSQYCEDQQHQQDIAADYNRQMEYLSLVPKTATSLDERCDSNAGARGNTSSWASYEGSGGHDEYDRRQKRNFVNRAASHGDLYEEDLNEVDCRSKGAIPKYKSSHTSFKKSGPAVTYDAEPDEIWGDIDNNVGQKSPMDQHDAAEPSLTAVENEEVQNFENDGNDEKTEPWNTDLQNLRDKLSGLMNSEDSTSQDVENDTPPNTTVEDNTISNDCGFAIDTDQVKDNSGKIDFLREEQNCLKRIKEIDIQLEEHTQSYSRLMMSPKTDDLAKDVPEQFPLFDIVIDKPQNSIVGSVRFPESFPSDTSTENIVDVEDWVSGSKPEKLPFDLAVQPTSSHSTSMTYLPDDFTLPGSSYIGKDSEPTVDKFQEIAPPQSHHGHFQGHVPPTGLSSGVPMMSPMYPTFGSAMIPTAMPMCSPSMFWTQPVVYPNTMFLQQMQMVHPSMALPMSGNFVAAPMPGFPAMPNPPQKTLPSIVQSAEAISAPVQRSSNPPEITTDFIKPPVPASQSFGSIGNVASQENVPPGFVRPSSGSFGQTTESASSVEAPVGISAPSPRRFNVETIAPKRYPRQCFKDVLPELIKASANQACNK